jgi:glycosyltransferase involved in cell wall biosynthesis
MTRVAVIVAAYNQAHLIGETLDSAIAQEGASPEVVVVDDGSSDDTAAVARSRPGVQVITQPNRGPAAARVAGLDASSAPYVVFLDGDDRLRPGALARGVRALGADPELAFASGRCVHISADGSPLPTEVRPRIEREHYRELLRCVYIYPPAAVTFRRTALDAVRPLNASRRFEGTDDYELYLRLARRRPVVDHGEIVVEYRRHAGNFASNNPERVLRSIVRLLRAERAHTYPDPALEEARRAGIAYWQRVLGREVADKAREHLRHRRWLDSARSVAALTRWAWPAVLRALGRRAARALRLHDGRMPLAPGR